MKLKIDDLRLKIGLGTAVLACTVSLTGQQQVPGAFRSRITMVPVDVRVLDKDGRPVTDLTRKEFQVFEDGRLQELAGFERIVFAPEPAATADAGPALRRAVGPDVATPSGRVFLFVLGRGRLQHPTRILDALIEFLDTQLLPQDHVALLAYNRATDFTRDHHKLKAVVRAYRDNSERIEARMTVRQSGLAATFGSQGVPPALQPDIDAIFKAAGAPGFREMPPARATDAARIEQDTRDLGNLLRPVGVALPVSGLAPETPEERSPLDAYMESNVKTLQDLGGLLAGIEYMRYLDGEKHLVFLTEYGLQLPRAEYDHSVADIASDARVAVDVIHTGGITSTYDRGLPRPNWAHTASIAGLKTLATRTGGRASIFRMGSDALADIDRVSRSQYLLGYYPSNAAQDGRFREITVKVSRPDVMVLFRKGYFARPQLVLTDRRHFMAFNRMVAAANFGGSIADIGIGVEAALDEASGEIRIRLAVKPDKLRVVERDGMHVIELDLAVFTADARVRPINQLWQRIDLSLTSDQLATALAHDIKYTLSFKPDRVPVRIKAIVYDHVADLIGSATAWVQ